jgi:hypothetical protein
MSDWNAELEQVKRQIAEIEAKILLQRQAARQLTERGADAATEERLIEIMVQRLVRTKTHMRFIESRIAKKTAAADAAAAPVASRSRPSP